MSVEVGTILLQEGFIKKPLETAGIRQKLNVIYSFIQEIIDVLSMLVNHLFQMGI